MRAAAFAAALLPLAAVHAQQPARQPAQQPGASADALELAELATPNGFFEELTLGDRIRAGLEEQLRPQLAADEAQYPGVTRAAAIEVATATQAILTRGLPGLRRRFAALFAGGMTPGELRQAVVFARSPAGRAVYASDLTNPDRDGDDPADRAALEAELSPADRAVWVAFRDGEAGRKLRRAGDKRGEVAEAWMLAVITASEKELNRAADAVVARYRQEKQP